jgi:hypothetical protein
MVDVTKIPLGQVLARLQARCNGPVAPIVAAIRSDSPDRISFGNGQTGLHYKALTTVGSPQQRGDAAITGHEFRRVTPWECKFDNWLPNSKSTWACNVEPVYTPAGHRI